MKRRRTSSRLAPAGILLAGSLALCACSSGTTTEVLAPLPPSTAPAGSFLASVKTMAVIGDSISVGENACSKAGPCPAESWAGGTDPSVDSVASRLDQAESTNVKVLNFAHAGAKFRDAADEANRIGATHAQLFVILLGSNDACSPSVADMTSTAYFSQNVKTVLSAISTESPTAHTLIISIPDLNRVWKVNHTNPAARKLWNESTSCTSLLGDAASTSSQEASWRSKVRSRVNAFNRIISSTCKKTSHCIYDNGSLHHYKFERQDISQIDYFHPAIPAQRRIAEIAWASLTR